ncbi:hypothetical protein JTL60_35050, partial [Pseudomonas aeruginosa]|nr:hypothetical protein [Pseudomonas aeruginosa]
MPTPPWAGFSGFFPESPGENAAGHANAPNWCDYPHNFLYCPHFGSPLVAENLPGAPLASASAEKTRLFGA